MLPLVGERERGRPMVRVIERAERDCGIQKPPLSEVGWRGAGRLILECSCRERIVLVGSVAVRRWCAGRLVLECGCGESFVLDRPGARSSVGEFRYSWLEGCLGRLEGKESRHEYYVGLEQAFPL
jgi:hypothetical protein